MKIVKRVANVLIISAMLVPAVSAAHRIANLQSHPSALPGQIVKVPHHSRAQLPQLQEELKHCHSRASSPTSVQPARLFTSTSRAQTLPASPTISVNTSVDGKSIHQGHAVTISWQTTNAPPESAVALLPEKSITGHRFAPITTSLPANGSYIWLVPIFVMQPIPCAPDITGGCVGSMNPGTSYRIIARLYTPSDADLIEFGPTKTYPTYLATAESATFTMLPAR
jgi:hypothetical protein